MKLTLFWGRFLHREQRQTGTKRGQKRHPWNNDAQPMSPPSPFYGVLPCAAEVVKQPNTANNNSARMGGSLCACSVLMFGLLLAFPALLWSQTNGLQSGDFPISGALRGDQVFPAVAVGASGGFVVWHDNITDPSGLGISARRLNAALVPGGEVIHVNQTLGNDQSRPKVAMLNDGGAIVVYESGKSGAQNVLARFLASSGGVTGDEVLVNDSVLNSINRYTTNWVLIRNNRPRTQKYRIRELIKSRHEFNANPAVITLNDGSLVVAYSSSRVYTTNTFGLSETLRWNDRRSIFITNRIRVPVNVRAEAMQDVYLQRLSAAGQKLGSEFRVNQFNSFNQRDGVLAALNNGNFVVAWVSEQQRFANSIDVYARIFDGLGNPLTGEFLVNTNARSAAAPALAGMPGGGFMIAWTERAGERANGTDIAARVFDAAGNATSHPFIVNTSRYGDQFAPSITHLGAQQLMVWNSMGQDGSWEGVYAQAFTGASALGEEFRVNVATRFKQMQPRAVSDGAGRALVIWSGYAVDGGFDVFGRSYGAP